MSGLALYDRLSKFKRLNYRGKIMVVAFLGTHIPLLAIIAAIIFSTVPDATTAWIIAAVALVATLIGTGVTLLILNGLLRPIVLTSRGLRAYRDDRALPRLPTGYRDEVGTLMADAMATLTELDDALDELANTDRVTGLPNRDRLAVALAARIEAGEPFALCTVKWANYERVAATFDQATARVLLSFVAKVLKSEVGVDAMPTRLEAGLFAFVVAGAGRENVGELMARLLGRFSEPMTHGARQIVPKVAGGVALWPDDALTADALIDAASAAVVSTGDVTGPGFAYFSPAAREAARERFLTEQELRRALAADEFRLYHQPVVDLARGRVTGTEALIRWHHPERGVIGPSAFIEIAERSGLIHPIGEWAITTAARQLAAWSGGEAQSLSVAVNLSARQFLDPNLSSVVRSALREAGDGAGHLGVEVTETAAMVDRRRTAGILSELRDLGVRVAIDDFGTGYSSMGYLKDLPFDLLKIDRSFVSGVHATPKMLAICEAVIALARGIGAGVLAEGVETEDEARKLHERGVSLFQGYYFAKPMPADDLESAISDLGLVARIMAAADLPREARRRA
ncbi:MAG: EAL domain-containing protein [Bauldia sp.]|nr:EAL domain-containing protein [Bauldia sp.]